MKKKFKVLVCPLDWGIGHATRCVPVIRTLLEEDFEVILAADGLPMKFLRDYFPELAVIQFEGTKIVYPESGSMTRKMILSGPAIIRGIRNEHLRLRRIIGEHNIDVVVSDNRFGVWTKSIPSIYMTHQVMIKAPTGLKWIEPILYNIHKKIISKYRICWIPDFPGIPNLSGDLAHLYPPAKNSVFIGPLSRFSEINKEQIEVSAKKYNSDILFLLSGPEPQRSILEDMIIRQTETVSLNSVVLRGLPGEESELEIKGNTRVFNHLADEEILKYIRGARIVVARPGYSTVMDLTALGKDAFFVPTPGQTEQEYLARHLKQNGYFDCIRQEKFDVSKIPLSNYSYHPPSGLFNLSLLRQEIKKLKIQL